MIDNDYVGLARVQNALAHAQQIYDEQKRKHDRLAAAGAPTHDAADTLGLLNCISQSFNVTETMCSPPLLASVIRSDKRIRTTIHSKFVAPATTLVGGGT
jgi:hypothetical protein